MHRSGELFRTTVAASFAFALVQLDVTIVNVALPAIGREYSSAIAALQWIVDAYTLTFAALLLSAGSLADRFGARRSFVAGIAAFGAASIACALAPDLVWLIASRVLQGIGAAAMLPASLSLIDHSAGENPNNRARAIAWWTAAGAIAIAAGPIAGGLLVQSVGWRAIFLVNIPLCAIALNLARRLPETSRVPSSSDVPGQALATLFLGCLIGAVIEAGRPSHSGVTPAALSATAVAAAIFFLRREQLAAHPVLPLRAFRSSSLSSVVAYGAVVNMTYYGTVFVLSIYLQRTLHYSPRAAGLAFIPLTATFLFANLLSVRVIGRWGLRIAMAGGALVDAAGFAILAAATSAAKYALLLPALVLIPGGMGTGVPAMTNAALQASPEGRKGTLSAALNSIRQAGGAIGVATFGALAGHDPTRMAGGLRLSAMIAVGLLLAAAVMSARWIAPGRSDRR